MISRISGRPLDHYFGSSRLSRHLWTSKQRLQGRLTNASKPLNQCPLLRFPNRNLMQSQHRRFPTSCPLRDERNQKPICKFPARPRESNENPRQRAAGHSSGDISRRDKNGLKKKRAHRWKKNAKHAVTVIVRMQPSAEVAVCHSPRVPPRTWMTRDGSISMQAFWIVRSSVISEFGRQRPFSIVPVFLMSGDNLPGVMHDLFDTVCCLLCFH